MFELFDIIANDNFEHFTTILTSQKGAIGVNNEMMWTLLHATVNQNSFDMVQYLLKKDSIPINSRCSEGKTCLLLACELENINLNIVTGILDAGADVNAASIDDVTPLHAACRTGDVAVAKILLERKANIHATELNGYTPLHYTALSNCVQTSQLLCKSAVNIDAIDGDGCTPLMLAVDVASVDVAVELILNGANVNVIARETTALHLSVVTQQTELFELLWDRTDFRVLVGLSECNNLLKVMVKFGWFFPDRVENLYKVLNHPNILQLLNERVKILQIFFYRIRFVKNIQDINMCDILRKFLQIKIPVYQCELRAFIQNFYGYDNRYEILDILIKDGKANFDVLELIIFAADLYPNLVPTLLSFCISVSPLALFEQFSGTRRIRKKTLQLLVLIMYLCTPSASLKKRCRNNIMAFSFTESISENELDYEMVQIYNNAISLLKIQCVPSFFFFARDKVRHYLSGFCIDSYTYLNILNILYLPKDIIDLIRCKIAVN